MADITEVKVSKFCTVQENIADSTYIAKIIDGKLTDADFLNELEDYSDIDACISYLQAIKEAMEKTKP